MQNRRATRSVLWVLMLALCALGIFVAVNRASSVSQSVRNPPPDGLARADQRSLDIFARALGLEPDSPRYQEIETDLEAIAGKFNDHPVLTLFHVVPGALFMLLVPFQFIARVRTRYPTVHRWCGRGLLLVAVPFAVTGLLFAGWAPFSGPVGGAASLALGVFFVVSGMKAYAAIRRRDIVRHREWMLRFVSVALGIAVVRVLDLTLLATTTARPQTIAGPSFWAGWLAALAVAEWWIRSTRSSATVTPVDAVKAQ